MNGTQQLHDMGQSLWLDNINRQMLNDGTLQHYIDALSITGLTSNPTIYDEAIGGSDDYDADIRDKTIAGSSRDALFMDMALDDLRCAADMFRFIFDATEGMDGWVSLEVSPVLARDAAGTIAAARHIHSQANRPNLLIKVPGTPEGLPAIEELIFAGVPVNVTLLFSCEQYLAAAEAYVRGVERRIAAGLNPRIESVASLFISRWDKSVNDRVAPVLRNRLGIAIGQRTYHAHLNLLASPRWQRISGTGAKPQRLLWASTGAKDAQASPGLYVEALAAPGTINTLSEQTLHAFAEHGKLHGSMPIDGDDSDDVVALFKRAGIDLDALAIQLQHDGTQSFIKSWEHLLERIACKSRLNVNPP